jgi:hypothetical protein
MDGRYPSLDEQQSVRLEFSYPDVRSSLSRWLRSPTTTGRFA